MNAVVARNVTLNPEDWLDAKRKAKEIGQSSFSAGVRAVFAEWRLLRAAARIRNIPPEGEQNHQEEERK